MELNFFYPKYYKPFKQDAMIFTRVGSLVKTITSQGKVNSPVPIRYFLICFYLGQIIHLDQGDELPLVYFQYIVNVKSAVFPRVVL